MMALSLAACGGSSTTTTATDTTTTDTTTTVDAAQAFVLKTTADVITGGSGDDTVSGTSGSIDGDTINAGAGDDTLSITVSNADDDNASFAATGLELLQIRGTGNGVGVVNVDLGDVAGLETVEFRRMAEDVTVTNLQDLDTALKISDTANANSNVVVSFDAAQVSGTADTATLTVDNVTIGADFDINGVETIAVTAVGLKNDIDIDGDKLEAMTVSGSGDISIDVDASVTTFNASTATGDVTMVATAAADVTATGGAGADQFTMGTTLTKADTLAGGAGTDTLSVTGAGGAVMPASAAVSGVENLEIVTGGADSFDASIVSFDSVKVFSTANAHTIAMTKVTDEAIEITTSAANAAAASDDDIADVNIQLADETGAADSLTVTFTNVDVDNEMAITTSDFGAGGIETLNLVFNQGADVPGADVEDIDLVDINSAHTTINVSGDADVSIASGTALDAAKTVNASALTGDLELNLGAVDNTVTGGSGKNTFAFGANLTSADTVTGGAGADVLTASLTAVNVAATVSGVETFEIVMANAGNNLNATNVTGIETLTLSGDVANVVTNLAATATTINLIEETDDETVSITYASGSDSAVTLNFDEVANGGTEDYAAITIGGNAGALTVNSKDGAYTVTSIVTADVAGAYTLNTTDALIVDGTAGIDAVKATSLAITTGGGNLDISGAATNSFTKATSINLQALDGDILMDNASGVLISDADVTVDMLARGTGNLIDVTTLNVDHVTTMNLTSENAGDVVITDLNMLGKNSATTAVDVDTLITMTATGTGSSTTISDLTPASATTLDKLVMTSSDSGVVSFTAADNNLTITEIDASGAAADGVVISVADLAAATKITLGAGDVTLTTSDNVDTVVTGSGDATITSTAGGAFTFGTGKDVITAKVASIGANDITGFDVAKDVINLDISEADGFTSSNVPVDYAGTPLVGALSAATIVDETGGSAFTMDAGTILRLAGTFADTAAVEAAIEGDMEDLSLADEDAIVVIWSDGANAHVDLYEIDAVNSTTSGVVDTVTFNGEFAQLIGTDVTKLTDANFDFIA
jgi:hypothetical protein